MAIRLAYLLLARVLSWLALLARSDAATTPTARTDRSISDHPPAALPRPAKRPFVRCDATASVAFYTSMCRSHDVTEFSAPIT